MLRQPNISATNFIPCDIPSSICNFLVLCLHCHLQRYVHSCAWTLATSTPAPPPPGHHRTVCGGSRSAVRRPIVVENFVSLLYIADFVHTGGGGDSKKDGQHMNSTLLCSTKTGSWLSGASNTDRCRGDGFTYTGWISETKYHIFQRKNANTSELLFTATLN